MMMMMMMNCLCGMVDRRKACSLISSRWHFQRSSPSRISDTPPAGFEPAPKLSSGSVEWSCAVMITTKPPVFHDFVFFFYLRKTTANSKVSFYVSLCETNCIKIQTMSLQPRTKYLRKTLVLMWNSALPGNFNFWYWQNFLFGKKIVH